MKKHSKTRQEKIDYDLLEKKQKDYLATGHGVGTSTPGGEKGNAIAEIIGRKSIMGTLDPDKNVA